MKEPTLLEWLQASLYFLPHVLFRLLALSFVFAFLGYYSIIVLAIIALAGLCLALPEVFKEWKDDGEDGILALLSLVLSLLAPIAADSSHRSDRLIMKRTITSTTLCLLATLLLIRTGPLLVEEDLLLHTNGLCHLNFLNSTGDNLIREQGHQELSGESDENNPLKPNQSAPSIYIMIEICYFSLDQ